MAWVVGGMRNENDGVIGCAGSVAGKPGARACTGQRPRHADGDGTVAAGQAAQKRLGSRCASSMGAVCAAADVAPSTCMIQNEAWEYA